MINTSMVSKDRLEFDPIIPEDERRFYQKAYPNVNFVRERKVHCTVCKMHIGTAPSNESIIRMHPILRVTHCKKCHEFYNSGEFSKGEDGSELYCRWCGQGGEVYCCSNCPFVFCKSCIISNLSRGVVADIEQNENWSCFNCAPKMLWPLRAQHWALIKFIDKQKKAILNSNLSDAEIKTQMTKDRSLCCKVKKTSGYDSDSSETSDASLSRLKQKAGEKRNRKSLSKEDLTCISAPAGLVPKKAKTNDEVVCTPDVMSMLEPECQLTVAPIAKATPQPSASSPKIMSIPQPPKRPSPPPLLIRNAQVPQVRPQAPVPIIKKTIVGPRMPAGTGGDFTTPVYHTINGYRIDLNSAAQQETVRLPNGKLIQVKRQGTGSQSVTTVQSAPNQPAAPARILHNAVTPAVSPIANVPTQQIVHSSGGHIIRAQLQTPRSITVQNPSIIPQFQQQTPQQYQQITIRQPNQQIATIRYQGTANQQVTNLLQNGTVQLLNGAAVTSAGQVATVRQVPTFVKQFFPNTPLGLSRNQLQNQIFNAMEICQHLMGKVQTLTNSNAYKTAKSLTDVKELYIHLSYLLTYAIGRFKGLQDNCLSDMRDLGFTNDANSLENGQLAAGTDMVRSGKITDFVNVDLDSFHALIVQNMDNMTTAAADSSTLDATAEEVEESRKLKQVKYDEHEVDGVKDDEKSMTPTEYDNYESFPSPVVEIIEDQDDDCLLVENLKVKTDMENLEGAMDSDDDDCLLVECGERKSDDEWNQQAMNHEDSDDEDEEELAVQRSGLSTSYENDDDYHAPPMSGFTHDLDTKLIELVRGMPALWHPLHQKTSSTVQQGLWKKITSLMPSGLNCRMRWKNLRYRYVTYQKRLANNLSGEYIPPHRNAFLLKFLDNIRPMSMPTARVQTNCSISRTSTPDTRDDHDFMVKLIGVVEKHPTLWHPSSVALIRHTAQPEVWEQIHSELKDEGYDVEAIKKKWKVLKCQYTRNLSSCEPFRQHLHFLKKQASDAEEDEISIVEPKTDTITLDSDNEDEQPKSNKPNGNTQQTLNQTHINAVINSVVNADNMNMSNQNSLITPTTATNDQDEVTAEFDFSQTANLLAAMLEVELTEGGPNNVQLPKKPRKKTTNKPNPTLLKQKEIQERERLDNMKKNDSKLKMQVQIPLNKVEEIYHYAKPLVDELKYENQENTGKGDETELLDPLKEDEPVQKKEEKQEEEEEDKAKAADIAKIDLEDDDKNVKDAEQISPEVKGDDKEEPEEVVVVVFEDLESSKETEEPKIVTDDNEESVEFIENEESQDSVQNLLQEEDSKSSVGATSEKKSEKEVTEDPTKQDEREEKLKEKETEEEEQEIYKIDEDDEEEETVVLTEYKNNTTAVQSPKESNLSEDKSEPMEVDSDPLNAEISNKNVDNSLENNRSSHNIDFKRILGRTEVV